MSDQEQRRQPAAAPSLPGENIPWVRMFRPTGTTKFRWLLVSESPLPFLTHWNGIASSLCTGGVEECFGCQHGLVSRWAAYLAAIQPGGRTQQVVTLTEGAARAMRQQKALPPPGQWRGREVDIFRMSASGNAPVAWCWTGKALDPAKMPLAVDVDAVVRRVLGLERPPSFTPTLRLPSDEQDDMVAGL